MFVTALLRLQLITHRDETRLFAGMSAALESKIEAAIAALSHPKDTDDKEMDDLDLSRSSSAAQRQAVPEIQPAPPRKQRDSGASAGWDSSFESEFDANASPVQSRPTVWHATVQKILQQVMVAAIILMVFWTQGKLPYQLNSRAENTDTATDTSSV